MTMKSVSIKGFLISHIKDKGQQTFLRTTPDLNHICISDLNWPFIALFTALQTFSKSPLKHRVMIIFPIAKIFDAKPRDHYGRTGSLTVHFVFKYTLLPDNITTSLFKTYKVFMRRMSR